MDEEQQNGLSGLNYLGGLGLGGLGPMGIELTSSEESKQLARQLLSPSGLGSTYDDEEDLLNSIEMNAEQSREALRKAREAVLNQTYDPAQKWLRIGQAFGTPTQTGAFGETMGMVSGALADERQREQAFNINYDDRLLNLDLQVSQADIPGLEARAKLAGAKRAGTLGLQKEALKVLSRPAQYGKPYVPPEEAASLETQTAIDKAFGKDATDWQQNRGSTEKNLRSLVEAYQSLSAEEGLTGWVPGLTKSLFGETAYTLAYPDSKETEDMVKGVVQQTLRQILGAQFTEKEGQLILDRAYNVLLSPKTNKRKLLALIQELSKQYQAKESMTQYFTENGTLKGYKGPTTDMEQLGKVLNMEEEQKARGGRVKYRQGGRVRRAEGGSAEPTLDELLASLEATATARIDEPEDTTGLDDLILQTGIGAGLGAGATGLLSLGREKSLNWGQKMNPDARLNRGFDIHSQDRGELIQIMKRMQTAGTPVSLMDQGPTGVKRVGEQAMKYSTPEKGDEVLADQQNILDTSADRVGKTINRGLKPYGYGDHEIELRDKLYANAAPLYNDLYKKYPGIREKDIPGFVELAQTPDGKKAVKMALRLLGNQGKEMGKVNPITGLVQRPSLEFLDYVKRGMDQLIATEESQGPTPLGKSMRELRTRMRDELDAIAPEYAEARMQYAGDLEVLDALQQGRQGFLRMDPEEVSTFITDRSLAERMAFRTGVARAINDKLGVAVSQGNDAKKLIGSPNLKARLEPLFDKPRDLRLFLEALQYESELFDNTKTSRRRNERIQDKKIAESLDDDITPSSVRDIARKFSPVDAVLRMIEKPSMTPQVADEILDMLKTRDPKGLDAILTRLEAPTAANIKLPKGKYAKRGAKAGAALGVIKTIIDYLDEQGEEDTDE
jgi:hypothetical protein